MTTLKPSTVRAGVGLATSLFGALRGVRDLREAHGGRDWLRVADAVLNLGAIVTGLVIAYRGFRDPSEEGELL